MGHEGGGERGSPATIADVDLEGCCPAGEGPRQGPLDDLETGRAGDFLDAALRWLGAGNAQPSLGSEVGEGAAAVLILVAINTGSASAISPELAFAARQRFVGLLRSSHFVPQHPVLRLDSHEVTRVRCTLAGPPGPAPGGEADGTTSAPPRAAGA